MQQEILVTIKPSQFSQIITYNKRILSAIESAYKLDNKEDLKSFNETLFKSYKELKSIIDQKINEDK